ncbi:MAG: ABC transporter ATP-binding protein [Acidobacteria bacterium]|nr:ABC transporter ATP-binding protein [Acidobacteriota bacterium]
MSEEKAACIDIDSLNKGKYLFNRLKQYMQLLETEFNHEKLPKRLQEMAKNGIEISTGKNFSKWYEYIDDIQVKMDNWANNQDNLDQLNFNFTINQWSELFQKLLSAINQVPLRAFELLNKPATKEDVEKIFIKEGKPLLNEILTCLNQFLGKPATGESPTKKQHGLDASLSMSYFRSVSESKWAIEISDVSKSYGDLEAVKGITLSIKRGEIFGLLGPNGAGKTSFIECIEGIRKPDSGEIFILGQEYTGNEKLIKEKIGVQLQSFGYYDTLTVKEILKLYASFFQVNRDINEIIHRLELEEKANTQVKKLSGGQLQRLALATALVNDPDVVFLDEPTSGLDPHGRRNMWHIIQGLQNSGKTIFLTTHYMEEAEFLCSRVAIMDEGKIIELASPEELIKNHTDEKTVVVYYKGTVSEDEINRLKGVSRSWIKDSRLTITSNDHKATLAGLLDWKTSDAVIEDIIIRRGNLEDVFLKLTNRGLDQ